MKILRISILVLLALALPILDLVTFRHTCDFKGHMGPEFYGLPFIYRTEIPWVNSFSGEFYILGYFGNVFFHCLCLVLLRWILNIFKLSGIIKKTWNVIWIGTSVMLITYATMFFFITEWRFEWTKSEIMNYADQSSSCTKTFEFGSTGK